MDYIIALPFMILVGIGIGIGLGICLFFAMILQGICDRIKTKMMINKVREARCPKA